MEEASTAAIRVATKTSENGYIRRPCGPDGVPATAPLRAQRRTEARRQIDKRIASGFRQQTPKTLARMDRPMTMLML